MRITNGQQGALHGHRIEHGRALADAPVVNVAARVARWNRVHHVRFLGCETEHTEMRADRHAYVLEYAPVLLDRGVVDRHAGIIDDLVHDTERIGLWRPAEVVQRFGEVALTRRVDLVDRDHFALLRLLDLIVVVKAPPRGGVTAEALALMLRIRAGPRLDVEDAHFEHIPFFGTGHGHRPRADVHAQALACTASEQRCI